MHLSIFNLLTFIFENFEFMGEVEHLDLAKNKGVE